MADDLRRGNDAREWETYKDAEHAHFAEMKRILDREGQDYAD